MSNKWTNEQKSAIEGTGGTLLVSAAAGSGKTAVLVERVIRRLTDLNNPCDADKLLIVTFTRAATSEMRERIGIALSKELKKNPTNSHLLRQQMLLPSANICTIDSFCNDLVKENFQMLNINPDFKIIDDGQRSILANEAVNEVIEELYMQDDIQFKELVELLFKGRDDAELARYILNLYEFSMAYPFPKKWLKQAQDAYCSTDNSAQSSWGKVTLDYVISVLDYCQTLTQNSINLINTDDVLADKYLDTFNSDLNQIIKIKEYAKNSDWDSVYNSIHDFDFIRLGRLPKGYESPVKDIVTTRRDKTIKKLIRETLCDIMCCNSQEFEDDVIFLKPLIDKLFEGVYLFSDRFEQKKREKNTLDFSDTTHLAIELLVSEENGEFKKTSLANELSEKYVEILLDEYQDTNMAQDILFSSISRDENNLFMVGDVKQSIYRFRQAMPEIFIKKREKFSIFNGENYPAVVNLDRNFRSRFGVVGMVNFVFSQLMSNDVGEVFYDNSEELKYGAEYEKTKNDDAQIHILDTSKNEETGNARIESEAKYIASLISQMIENGFCVRGKDGGQRLATYGDFCILLRSPKGRSEIYAKELLNRGIPAYTDSSGGFFSTYEVQVILSLLRVLDNPLCDIPLLSAMMSPIYAFTPDEISKIRMIDRNAPLYNCIVRCAKNGNEQCKDFLEEITILRRFSAALPVCELIRKIYEHTDYTSIVLAMENGENRYANLNLLLDYANNFDSEQANGLCSFIRHIDRLEQNKVELASAGTVSPNADVVRIMSIHKSKGLEFPVCIIANCSGKFNKESLKNNMILHSKIGVGIKRRNTKNMHEFSTIMHTATKLAVENDEISEEMRVLYVAMTRAKEKIITVLSINKPQNKIKSLGANILNQDSIPTFAVRKSQNYADWLLYASLRHPDAVALRSLLPDVEIQTMPADFKLDVVFGEAQPQNEITEKSFKSVCDKELLDEINSKVAYEYPYKKLEAFTTKRAASQNDVCAIDTRFFANSRPAFLNKGGLTPAQRGTALHKYMQFANYNDAKKSPSLELERILKMGFLSKEEAETIELLKIDKFFNSTLAKRIFNSKQVMREKKFAINLPVTFYDPNLDKSFADEKVLVQGIVDCAFVEDDKLVILDYKTDKVKDMQSLVEKYKPQLEIYCKALFECTGFEIKDALLYSFELGDFVKVF